MNGAARREGIRIRALDNYRRAETVAAGTENILVLGYGGIKENRVDSAINALAKIIEK